MTTHAWPDDVRTLAIDIGGSGFKGAVLDPGGQMLTERVRMDTPYPCPPEKLVSSLVDLTKDLGEWHRVSVGFPGLVRNGKVRQRHFVRAFFKSRGVALVWRIEF